MCLQNDVTEEEQRWGSKTVEGSGRKEVESMKQLREQVKKEDSSIKKGLCIIVFEVSPLQLLMCTKMQSPGFTCVCVCVCVCARTFMQHVTVSWTT